MKLTDTVNNREYILEFTRETVKECERMGFALNKVAEQPMTQMELLFRGAFLARHRRVSRNVIEDLYDQIADKTGLFQKLGELYAEPMRTMYDEDVFESGNVTWTEA